MTSQGRPQRSRTGDSHWGRLVRGVGANLLGKFWVVLSQIVTVPVLLTVWGAKGYGVWLMIWAIPSYVTLSDFGFGSAAAIFMTAMIARGERDEALGVFQSVGLLVTAILAVIVLVAVAVWSQFGRVMSLIGFEAVPSDTALAFLLLTLYSAVWVEMMVVQVGFRSTKRYARGTVLLDIVQPVETALALGVVWIFRSYVAFATILLVIRLPALLIYYVQLRRDEPWLHLGWSHASWRIVRRMMKPALANFGMPLGLAMSLQGVIVTVGIVFGPAAAGIFGAVRTVTRLPLQLVTVITRASQPELTIAHSLSDKPLIARLVTLSGLTTIICIAPFLLISPWAAPVMRIISHGQVSVQPGFYAVMQCLACLQAITSALAMFLFAENKLQKIVVWYLLAGGIAMAAPLLLQGRVSLTGLAVVYAIMEMLIICIFSVVWWRGADLSLADFATLAQRLPMSVSARLAALTTRRGSA